MRPGAISHERRDRAVRPDGGSARTLSASGPAAGILRLQRAAGNRAVRTLLRAPTSLGELGADVRGRIQTATAPVVGAHFDLEDFGGSTSGLPAKTTVVWGNTVPTDTKFRAGLQSIAADLITQTYSTDDNATKPTNFREDSTLKFAFDFSKQKGANGVWQFTYVKVGAAGAHQLFIEFLGPLPSFAAPGNVDDKVKQLGYSITGFAKDEREFVLETIALLPNTVTTKLPSGLKFARQSKPTAGACGTSPEWASGDYCHTSKTVTMYDRWTAPSSVVFTRASDQARMVMHEVGHALDENNASAHAAFDAAVTADGGTPISGYAAKSSLESYAECFSVFMTDPELLKTLRPNVHKYFTDRYGSAAAGAAAGSGSGSAAGSGAAGSGSGSAAGSGSGSAAAGSGARTGSGSGGSTR
jgi:hypothetical protein